MERRARDEEGRERGSVVDGHPCEKEGVPREEIARHIGIGGPDDEWDDSHATNDGCGMLEDVREP
jgi:hypothetical protein